MTRRATIAALTSCGAAGLIAAVLLATAPAAGADDGTVTSPPATTVPPPETTVPPPETAVPPPETAVPPPATKVPPHRKATPRPEHRVAVKHRRREPILIAAGVTIGGTPVGGLTAAEARAVVKARFVRPLVLVGGPGSRIRVLPGELGAALSLEKAVRLATHVRRPGFSVPLAVRVSRPRIERLVASLGRRFRRDPVGSRLELRGLEPVATGGLPGRRLREAVAARAIVLALKTQSRDPLLLPFEAVSPAAGSDAPGRAIVIRRDTKKLLLYQVAAAPKLIRSFSVATGRPEFPTPLGTFEVTSRQYNPWWYPPAGSAWARGALPVPPGPGNPLGTRWMGISSPYIGIHGTPDAASVGYSASHGCIRMLIPQVEWLFTRVDVGTPVFIVAA